HRRRRGRGDPRAAGVLRLDALQGLDEGVLVPVVEAQGDLDAVLAVELAAQGVRVSEGDEREPVVTARRALDGGDEGQQVLLDVVERVRHAAGAVQDEGDVHGAAGGRGRLLHERGGQRGGRHGRGRVRQERQRLPRERVGPG